MSVSQDKYGTYAVHFRVNGKQKKIAFGKEEQGKLDAEAYNDSIREKKAKAKKRQKDKTSAIGGTNEQEEVVFFDQLFHKYAHRNPLKEIKKWERDWRVTLKNRFYHELSQGPITELTEEFIVNLVVRKSPKASPHTQSKYISYLKMTFNYGVEKELIAKNPLRTWKELPSVKKNFDLEIETIKEIRKEAAPHLALALDIMVNTGLRTGMSELLKLQYKDILWKKSSIKVFATKTQKWRTIPVSQELLETLREKQEQALTGYIIEYRGRPIKNISRAFRKACKRAGIDDKIVLYDLRHWYCNNLLSNGTPVNTASALMGHSSAKMTLDVYGHAIPSDVDKVVNLIPSMKD